MQDARTAWLETLERYCRDRDRPASERYWSPSLDTASLDALREIQSAKLRAAIRYAYECIPFYRRKFDRIGLEPGDIRSVDDLTRIPITTKQEMAEDLAANPPWGTYTAVDDRTWLERGWQVFATSGTTAQARAFRYTHFDRAMWAWTNARAMWAMGFRPGRDSALLAFGYGPHVWLWGVHYALNLMGIPIVTAGGLDSRTRARFIHQYRPTILACTPSYALYLGNVMREIGFDPAESSVRYLFCAGEPGYSVPATRRRLEELWQADLHEFYGCTEAAPSAGGYTCAAAVSHKEGPAATHLMGDTHIWETVDPVTLTPVPEGQRGLSVVTNLCSEASPQLRFLVGDFTTLSYAPCECGRTHPRAIGGFLGRADDMLNIRGITIFPSAIEDAVRQVPEVGEEFQIVVSRERELDVLTVVVEPRPEVAPERHAVVAQRVETEIVSRCELRPVVQLVPHGTLPKTEFKARRVKDLRQG
ncbi:MAG TPA: AMP-binding protein [Chloroflexota bacterium]|nr:AMP-binding protein [Chloroflexota bacterium]